MKYEVSVTIISVPACKCSPMYHSIRLMLDDLLGLQLDLMHCMDLQ